MHFTALVGYVVNCVVHYQKSIAFGPSSINVWFSYSTWFHQSSKEKVQLHGKKWHNRKKAEK